MRLRNQILHNRGTSLVEVLVALTIFVVGILTVVRMFPPGFRVVKQSESVTLANRLAQSELERLKGTSANLPVGILARDPSVLDGVITGISPDDLTDLPGTSGDPYYTDVNKFRRIYAEATRIPSPIDYNVPNTSPGDPLRENSIYVMSFSPVDPNRPIVVRSGPMRRRGVPESGRSVRSTSEYAIDYNAAKLYVRPLSYPREYVINYSYWTKANGRPELRPVLSAVVVVPAMTGNSTTDGIVDIPRPADTGFMYIDSGSDSLHRSFSLIANNVPWDTGNPYQYKIFDQVRGVIGLNPAGHGYEETTQWGRVALTAYIDYDVLDWHIIREEKKLPDASLLPSAADLSMRLTLRFVKNAGLPNVAPPAQPATVEYNGDTYAGLSAGLPFSILAIDIQTGEWFYEETQISSGQWAFEVNYKDGIIKFHPGLAGRTFRVYYRAEGDWALQVFKAYETYRRSYNFSPQSAAPLDHREWFGSMSNAGDGVPHFDGPIHFARCYDGMSVAIDYTYRIANGNNFSRYFFVEGDSYQTDKALGASNTCAIDPRVRVAKLRECDPSEVQVTRITRVYGVSVGARVIWREGSRGFRPGKWKNVDLQTYLLRLQD